MRHMEVQNDRSGALRSPDYVDARVLAASTAEAHEVPAGANYVIFSANVDFYVLYNATAAAATAAVPAADITDGTAPELNPTIRFITGIAELSIIAPAAGIVTMAFYKS